MPTLTEYLAYWLAEVIKPNRESNTYSQYELFSRRYIIPGLGQKHIDRLTVRDVQIWLNKLPGISPTDYASLTAGSAPVAN